MDDKIEHFSHTHPLLLKEEHKNEGGQVLCSGCEKPISGPVFCCDQCNYVLHKSCAELPQQMKHPLHPQHPLTLHSTSPYQGGPYICDACSGIYKSFCYHCSVCQFDLDMSCASSWHQDDGHMHAFIPLTNSHSFVCYACGEEASEGIVSSMCTICQIWVHSSCSELPQTITIKCHHHPLNLTYSLHQVYGFKDDITCGACNGKLNSTFAGYFCSTCKFPVHLKCAGHHSIDEDKVDENEIAGVSDNEESYSDSENDQFQTPQDIIEPDNIGGVSFFCHDHLLTFVEEMSVQYADKLCDGCIQPITTPPFFSCAENCGFLLHQSCAELPRTMLHRFHPHPLTLVSKEPSYDGIFRCDGCKCLSNGFVYRCDECQFDLDVICGSLMETFKHESHKHPLVLEKTSIARQCKSCHLWSKNVFVCDVCEDFAIDCGCATLPSKAWHMYDKHPLSLTYFGEGNLSEHDCGICKEKKRGPKQWFYYCDDCDFVAHPNCVIGKYRKVKFGGTFQYDAHHSHPLALVEEIGQHPPKSCEACGELCNNGWTLECGMCRCYFHREGKCFWEQFKQSAKYLAFSGRMRHRYAANVLAATPNVTTK